MSPTVSNCKYFLQHHTALKTAFLFTEIIYGEAIQPQSKFHLCIL